MEPPRIPVPKPRKINSNPLSNAKVNQDFVPTLAKSDIILSEDNKPIPLPRKLYQRLKNEGENNGDDSDSSSSDSEPLLDDFNPQSKWKFNSNDYDKSSEISFEESGTVENKRGTLNLFQRKIGNPFDNDFETSLRDAELLRTHLYEETDTDVRNFFSSVSNNNSSILTNNMNISQDNSATSSTKIPLYKNTNINKDFLPSNYNNPIYENNFTNHNNTKSKVLLEKMVSCPGNVYNYNIDKKNQVQGYASFGGGSSQLSGYSFDENEDENEADDDEDDANSKSLYEPIYNYSSTSSTCGSNISPKAEVGLHSSSRSNKNKLQNAASGLLTKRITIPNIEIKQIPSTSKYPPQIPLRHFKGNEAINLNQSFDTPTKRQIEIYSLKNSAKNLPTTVVTTTTTTTRIFSSNRNFLEQENSLLNEMEHDLNKNKISLFTPNEKNNSNNNFNFNFNPHDYDEVANEDDILHPTNPFRNSPKSNSSTTSTSSANFISSIPPTPLPRNPLALDEFEKLFLNIENKSENKSMVNENNRYEYIDSSPSSSSSYNSENFNPTGESGALGGFNLCDGDELKENQLSRIGTLDKSDSKIKLQNSDDKVLEKENSAEVSSISSNENERNKESSSPQSSTSRGLFKKFSKKVKPNKELIAIKEEHDKNSAASSSSSSSSIVSTKSNIQIQPCSKCSEEHLENVKCKFSLPINENVICGTFLYRPTLGLVGKRDLARKRVVLNMGKMSFLNDKADATEKFPIDRVAMMSKKHDQRVNNSNSLQDLKFFQLNFAGSNKRIVLGGDSEKERSNWMQKYIESFTVNFPEEVTLSYDRAGWCFIKASITSEWTPGWLTLKDRTLYYYFFDSQEINELDLRKVRSIIVTQKDAEYKCPYVDNLDVLSIDMICKVLYIQADNSKLISLWEQSIKNVAFHNGPQFHEKQLTVDNVPVIVEKCIDFLYAHGVLAEGIYRQSGSNIRIAQLLLDFQFDAWSVQISPKEYTAHDVAGTLKRFFRSLPESLFTDKLYKSWISASRIEDFEWKVKMYISLLDELPEINFNILKKLVCHLYAVHELNEKNLMPFINLAPIFGPTLMSVDVNDPKIQATATYQTTIWESEVVKDLIENYYRIFRINESEIAREKKIQDALENFHLGSIKRKVSGDIKMWIYIGEKEESSTVNVTLTPLNTAQTIVQQLCHLGQVNTIDPDKLSLHEICLSTQESTDRVLERPLHPSEKVIEIILRWSIWDLDERKDNYLILKENTIYPAILPYAIYPNSGTGYFKFAESNSKSFRKHYFEIHKTTLRYSKDSKFAQELGSWNIKELVVYMGCEPKRRTPPTSWTLTFVTSDYSFKRCKEEPYFGNVISFSSEEEMLNWYAKMSAFFLIIL